MIFLVGLGSRKGKSTCLLHYVVGTASLLHLMDLLNDIKGLKFCFKKKEPLDCATCLQSFLFEQITVSYCPYGDEVIKAVFIYYLSWCTCVLLMALF